jgi:hypothetical protein
MFRRNRYYQGPYSKIIRTYSNKYFYNTRTCIVKLIILMCLVKLFILMCFVKLFIITCLVKPFVFMYNAKLFILMCIVKLIIAVNFNNLGISSLNITKI